MRRFVLLSLIAFILVAVGCVGTLEPFPPDNTPDAGTTTSGSGGTGGGGAGGTGGANGGAPDAGTPGGTGGAGGTGGTGGTGAGGTGGTGGSMCIAAVAPPGSGHHNAGTECLGCHNGSTATRWTVAGTLYDGNGAVLSGATIELVQGNGQTIQIATCTNGNFYISQAVVFPLTVRASQCPANAPMVSTVQAGGCNSCHGSAMRIHLP